MDNAAKALNVELLSHIRVLDLSRILAGPWSSQLLADLGADVIKVERPENGDDARAWGPPFMKDAEGQETREGSYFLAVNRGKRSVTVDLATPEGQEIVRSLVQESDVVIENYKVGTLARFGLDYATLSQNNPSLIYCSVTGFGQSGPMAAQPAYDFLIQAMGGLMSVTGSPDTEPQKVGVPIVDMVTGIYATVGILAALTSRAQTGKGQYIDVAMLDVQVGLLANQAMNYLLGGRTPQRNGNAHPNIQPQKVYRCRDGDMVLVVGNDSQFRSLCKVLGQPQWADDERFASNGARVRNQETLQPLLEACFVQEDRATWVQRLTAGNVPSGPINNIPEVFAEPQVQHRAMLQHLPHELVGTVPQVSSPLCFGEQRAMARRGPPTLGQHTQEVLEQLGLDPDRIAVLRSKGVV